MGRLARIGVSELFAFHGQDARALALPEKDARVKQGDIVAQVLIGGKEVDVASPIAGRVIAVNTLLETEADLVGADAYDTGWLAILRPIEVDMDALFTAEEYCAYVTTGSKKGATLQSTNK